MLQRVPNAIPATSGWSSPRTRQTPQAQSAPSISSGFSYTAALDLVCLSQAHAGVLGREEVLKTHRECRWPDAICASTQRGHRAAWPQVFCILRAGGGVSRGSA